MCLWDEPVEDGVGDGWLSDVVVPFGYGYLGGDHGAGTFVAVFQDLK